MEHDREGRALRFLSSPGHTPLGLGLEHSMEKIEKGAPGVRQSATQALAHLPGHLLEPSDHHGVLLRGEFQPDPDRQAREAVLVASWMLPPLLERVLELELDHADALPLEELKPLAFTLLVCNTGQLRDQREGEVSRLEGGRDLRKLNERLRYPQEVVGLGRAVVKRGVGIGSDVREAELEVEPRLVKGAQ